MNQDANIAVLLSVKDEMSGGLSRIQRSLEDFQQQWKQSGKTMQSSLAAASSQMEKSGAAISGTLKSIDQQNLKSIGNLTKLTGRLFGLQAGLASLGQVAGSSGAELSKTFKVAQASLNSFAAVVGFLPTPAGAAAGAVAALATAMVQLADTAEGRGLMGLMDPDLEKRFKAQMQQTGKLRDALTQIDDAWKKLGLQLDLTSRDKMETARAQFSALQGQVLTLKGILPGLRDELAGAFNALKGTALSRDKKLLDAMGLSLEQEDLKTFENLMYKLRELNDGHGGTEYTRAAIDALGAAFQNLQNVSKRLGVGLDDLRSRELGLVGLEVEKLQRNLEDIAATGAVSVRLGITTPLELAGQEATTARANVAALLNLIQRLKNAQIADPETRKQIDGLVKSLEGSTLGAFASKAKETEELRKQREEWERIQKIVRSMNFTTAWSDALQEFMQEGKSLKDVFKDSFQILQDAGADAFGVLIGHSKKFGRSMRDILKEIGNAFRRLASDFASSIFTRSALSLLPGFAAMPGLPGLPGLPNGAQPMAGGGAVSPLGPALGLGSIAAASGAGSAAATGGLFGLSSLSLLGLLGGVGLTAASGQMKSPVAGTLTGLSGGLLAGFSVGGPVGAIIGGGLGALFGGFGSSKEKQEQEKQKEEAEQAAQDAAEKLEEQRKRAASIIRQHIRATLGGSGLATPEAAMAVGQLFSGDISASELESFGNPDAILARQGEVANLAGANGIVNNVDVGGITVRVDNLSSSYDIEILAQDLAYQVRNKLVLP